MALCPELVFLSTRGSANLTTVGCISVLVSFPALPHRLRSLVSNHRCLDYLYLGDKEHKWFSLGSCFGIKRGSDLRYRALHPLYAGPRQSRSVLGFCLHQTRDCFSSLYSCHIRLSSIVFAKYLYDRALSLTGKKQDLKIGCDFQRPSWELRTLQTSHRQSAHYYSICNSPHSTPIEINSLVSHALTLWREVCQNSDKKVGRDRAVRSENKKRKFWQALKRFRGLTIGSIVKLWLLSISDGLTTSLADHVYFKTTNVPTPLSTYLQSFPLCVWVWPPGMNLT